MASVKIRFLPHSEEKLVERVISRELVEATLDKPDDVRKARFGRYIALKRIDGKFLSVIFEEKDGIYIVVTAYYLKEKRVKGLQ